MGVWWVVLLVLIQPASTRFLDAFKKVLMSAEENITPNSMSLFCRNGVDLSKDRNYIESIETALSDKGFVMQIENLDSSHQKFKFRIACRDKENNDIANGGSTLDTQTGQVSGAWDVSKGTKRNHNLYHNLYNAMTIAQMVFLRFHCGGAKQTNSEELEFDGDGSGRKGKVLVRDWTELPGFDKSRNLDQFYDQLVSKTIQPCSSDWE